MHLHHHTRHLALFFALKCGLAVTPASAITPIPPESEKLSFNAHIRPIFSDTCFACHGFDAKKRKANLGLDTPEGAYAKLKDSDEYAIVPGKPEQSAVMKRLLTNDPDEIMPPPDFHKTITPEQKKLIERWIREGATYEQHWSFAPIKNPPLPSLSKFQSEVHNPIDAFVLKRLEQEQLTPAPLADRRTLLRRLSLDLTGLPPSPADYAAFEADNDAQAYEKQVDRLLASPHYGERMAVSWLDVVRFADTVGYHGDQNARVFPYRDYVIRAFNDNKPFDQFTLEQLAGDLLENATDEQKIATGFLRLNLMTREGGAQPNEYLTKSMADRVRAVGAAWLGLTTGCAECHTHKFDPLTIKDFYSLGAFFADVRQWGVYADYTYTPNPELRGVNNEWPFPPEIYSKSESLTQKAEILRNDLIHQAAQASGEIDKPSFDAWLLQQREFIARAPSGWLPLSQAQVQSQKATPFEINSDEIIFTGPPRQNDVISVSFPLPALRLQSIRLEVPPNAKNAGKVGRQSNGSFAVTPSFAIKKSDGTLQPIEIQWAQADRRTPKQYSNGSESAQLESEWRSAPGIWEEPRNAASLKHEAIFHLKQSLAINSGEELVITLKTTDLGALRVSCTPFVHTMPGETQAIHPSLLSALRQPTADASSQHQLIAAYRQNMWSENQLTPQYRETRQAMIECRAGYAYSLISQPIDKNKIPVTHVLTRGNWMTPAEETLPGFPAFLSHSTTPSGNGQRLNRIDLAKWLMSEENPLPARHFSNRLWKQFFGKGLSNVLDDLGSQGEWPSHPELIDWLAHEFQHSKWDVKHMVKLIVMSRTYQQSAAQNADLASKDPANRLLAEQSPRRLDAEFVRDNALAISGLLNDAFVGGPSIKPYQPAGYYVNLNFPERDYLASKGQDQYRRGLYMHWQRTFMHPMLAAFDAPSREECTADRFQSNSPQQALTLLNDPSFVEAAQGFATRLLANSQIQTDEQRLQYALECAVGRVAKPEELKSLQSFLSQQRDYYRSKPEEAQTFLKFVAKSPSPSMSELAAWAQTCRVILNLHETLTRY